MRRENEELTIAKLYVICDYSEYVTLSERWFGREIPYKLNIIYSFHKWDFELHTGFGFSGVMKKQTKL
jgi:hypothetical protein